MTIFVIGGVLAFLLALAATPITRRLGHRLGLVDVPGGRRRHKGAISRLGGIAMYVGFVVALIVCLLLPASLQPPRQDPHEVTRLIGLLVGCTFVFVIGLIDDRWHLGPLPQFAAQLIAGGLSIPFLIIIERVNNPLTNSLLVFPVGLVIPFTLFWIAGMINTVNFLDGVDGLAAGVTAIVCVVLTIHMLREGQDSVALLPLILLGAVLGFLPFNLAPAKVFMGSTGSWFLGYALGALSIIAGAKMATVLLVMCIPIMDVAWQIFSRWRAHRSMGQGDRGHLHHRLLDLGMTAPQVTLFYYVLCAVFGALALLISDRLYKLVALILVGLFTLGVLVFVGRRQMRREASHSEETNSDQ